MGEHTKGPWSINKHGAIVGGEFVQYANGSGQSQLAMATGAHNISDEERNANARLIAAAPELLDLARAILTATERDLIANTTHCDSVGVLYDAAKAVIAKATADGKRGEA